MCHGTGWNNETDPESGCPRDADFRRVINSRAIFLYCQATQLDASYRKHPLWAEIHPWDPSAVRHQTEDSPDEQRFIAAKSKGADLVRRKTTVTPYVFNCFQHLPWGKFLFSQAPSNQDEYEKRVSAMQNGLLNGMPQPNVYSTPGWEPSTSTSIRPTLSIGDVVAIPSDVASSWKNQGTEWYGLIQALEPTDKGLKLGLLWLYRPTDTACMEMRYPHENELFLSDHCNCGDLPIYEDEVVRKGEHDSPSLSLFIPLVDKIRRVRSRLEQTSRPLDVFDCDAIGFLLGRIFFKAHLRGKKADSKSYHSHRRFPWTTFNSRLRILLSPAICRS